MSTVTLFPGLKRLMCEADLSPTSRTEVKDTWSYTSTPPEVFMMWCLMKQRIRFHCGLLS